MGITLSRDLNHMMRMALGLFGESAYTCSSDLLFHLHFQTLEGQHVRARRARRYPRQGHLGLKEPHNGVWKAGGLVVQECERPEKATSGHRKKLTNFAQFRQQVRKLELGQTKIRPRT